MFACSASAVGENCFAVSGRRAAMGLLQAIDSVVGGLLGTGGVSERFRRVVRAAYAVFLAVFLVEIALLATGASLPGVLQATVHVLAALSLVAALGAAVTYYVATGAVWPSA